MLVYVHKYAIQFAVYFIYLLFIFIIEAITDVAISPTLPTSTEPCIPSPLTITSWCSVSMSSAHILWLISSPSFVSEK